MLQSFAYQYFQLTFYDMFAIILYIFCDFLLPRKYIQVFKIMYVVVLNFIKQKVYKNFYTYTLHFIQLKDNFLGFRENSNIHFNQDYRQLSDALNNLNNHNYNTNQYMQQ